MDALTQMASIGFLKRLLGSHDQPPIGQRAPAGMRVLVVDDSPTICAVLGKMLGGEGYDVLKAGDGTQAIALARSAQPALIFLDVVMPGLNGFSVLRKLRHDPLTADIPIIMISGNQQATEQFYVQRFGADDFMKKPFGRDEVCQRIATLVAAGRLPARGVAEVPVSSQSGVAGRHTIPAAAMPDFAQQQGSSAVATTAYWPRQPIRIVA